MKAVIIDDIQGCVDSLNTLIKTYIKSQVKVLGSATNLVDGIQLINKVNPDVVFLDIEMPTHGGLSIYNFIPKPKFQIIFTTAHSKYAIEAIRKKAADYLLKPIKPMELAEAIERVKSNIKEIQQVNNIEENFKSTVLQNKVGKDIMFPVNDGFFIESSNNIEYCYAEQAYSVVVVNTGRKITISKPLKDLEAMLPEGHFYRTHKSYLVNAGYIRKFVKSKNSYVLLSSGERIPVSVRNSANITADIQELLNKE